MTKFGQFLCGGLALIPLILLTTIDSRADEQPTVPWTQEKYKPPEVEEKDKKNDQPVATCEKKGKDGRTYHQVTYTDGTVVKYWPDGSDNWEIQKTGPNGVTKISYTHLTGAGINGFSGSKSVKEPGPGKDWVPADPKTDPGAKKWKEDMEKKSAEEAAKKKTDLTPRFAPEVRQASLPAPWFDNWLTNVGYTAYVASPVFMNAVAADTPAPLQLAATAEKTKPQEKPEVKQAHVVINLKVVTYGGPPPGMTIHFDPEDPKKPKPDEFAKTDKPQNTWKPDDEPGPQTTPGPKPGGGIPVPTDGGGWVNIGGGWATVRIPISFIQSCSSDDDDSDDGPAKQGPAPKADPKK
jgi:hypothetical protein